jgi:PAS domain S-box-containing protein
MPSEKDHNSSSGPSARSAVQTVSGSSPTTEDELHKRERELGETQRLGRVGTWEWDPENDKVIWSEELYHILGLEPQNPAPSFKEHAALYSRESYRELQKAVATALDTGQPYELDLEVLSARAPSRWIRGRGEAIRDENGRVVRLRGTAQDITEKRRTQEALRDSEERFRLAAQSGRMFAYEWDVRSDNIVRSEQAIEILRIPAAVQSLGADSLARVHTEDRERAKAAVAALTPDNSTYRVAIREMRGDGETIWLERTGRGFFDEAGNLIKVIGMAVDVTERKRAEDIVREGERKFRKVFREAVVGMVIVSLDGSILEANDTFCDRLGYTEAEIRHKSVESLTHPEDWFVLKKNLCGLVQKGVAFRRLRTRCIRKDGGVVDTESSATLICDANGHPQCALGEVLDISERNKAEETLSNMNRRLIEAQEQERVRIARELHDDITQRMALVTVELEEVARNLDPSARKIRAKIRKLRRESEEITSDVQLISHRLHSSKLEHLGLAEAAKSVCDEFNRQHNCQVIFSQQKLPSQLTYEVSLSLFRVLQEAVHNAIKHSGAKKINAQLSATSSEVVLTVSDSGCGFDPESPNTQTGIGLLSMRERLALVRGTLNVSSAPRRGTIVQARVPLREKAKAAGVGS